MRGSKYCMLRIGLETGPDLDCAKLLALLTLWKDEISGEISLKLYTTSLTRTATTFWKFFMIFLIFWKKNWPFLRHFDNISQDLETMWKNCDDMEDLWQNQIT